MEIKSYKDLIVWQKSMDLVEKIYVITQSFPKEEKYSLTSQIRRCSVSIPSNISEGTRRVSRKDYRHFLAQAYGSGLELETQIEIAKRLKFERREKYRDIDSLLTEVMKILNKIMKNLQ